MGSKGGAGRGAELCEGRGGTTGGGGVRGEGGVRGRHRRVGWGIEERGGEMGKVRGGGGWKWGLGEGVGRGVGSGESERWAGVRARRWVE